MADAPEFDFSQVSWGMARQSMVAQTLMQKAIQTNDPETLERALDLIQQYLAKVVVSVPRAWLVGSAPEELDWRDPASFNHLLQRRMGDLLRAMNEAQSAGELAKN
jgi:hypothetical protein